MAPLRALVVDGDEGYCEKLRSWLAGYDLDLVVSPEWSDGLAAAAPAVLFLGVELPDKAGLVLFDRAKALWPGVPVVLASATIPSSDLEPFRRTEPGVPCLDKGTLTRGELQATVDALIGPVPARSATDRGAEGEAQQSQGDRIAELEEELRSLRWELDETRSAGGSNSRDFLRLSGVISSKEKDIVRLKKEIFARDHKLATGQRTLREATARALVATRERDAATGHAAQLQRDLEAEQAETRRLRLEAQRQAAEAEHAVAALAAEREQHDETRRQHEVTLAAHGEVLKQVKDQAVASVSEEWRARLKALRRRRARALAMLQDRLKDLQEAHRQELAARDAEQQDTLGRAASELGAAHAEAERRREEELATARAAAERQREELERLHEASMAEVLAAHADAERRAEQHRLGLSNAETRLGEERTRAVGATVAEWETRLEGVRRAHADSLEALRRHFQEQIDGTKAAREQERATRDSENDGARRRSAEELSAARADAARLEAELRQVHAQELAELEARHHEELLAAETRLRDGSDQALAAVISAWERRLEEGRRDHGEKLGSLQASSARDLAEARADALRIEQETRHFHERELAEVRARHVEALAALESRLRNEKDQAVAAAVAAWDDKQEELRRAHTEAIDELRRQHGDVIASLEASLEQAAVERDAAHQSALRHAAEEGETLRAAADQRLREDQARAFAGAIAGWESRLEELRIAQAGSLETLRQQHQDQLSELQATSSRELARLHADHQAALRQAEEELAAARAEAVRLDQETRQHYEMELARAESRHHDALIALEMRLRSEQEQAVAAVSAARTATLEETRRTHAAALEALRREHQDMLDALRAAREEELAQEDQEHELALRRLGEELAAARAKAAQPGPSQVLARHAEALKSLETRLHEEKEQAVAAAAAEWKAKLERLRRGHADALAALRREHEDQLLALGVARNEAGATDQRAATDGAGKVVPIKKPAARDRSS
jgi:hypothetical protein